MTGQAIMSIEQDFGARYTYNFTVDSPLSLNTILDVMQVSIYPNPTEGSLTIEGNDMNKAQIRLINNLKQEISIIRVFNKESVVINSQNLSSGVYSEVIIKDKGIVTKKWVVS